MVQTYSRETVERMLSDITGNDLPWGNIIVIAGDLPKIIPVVRRGTRGQVVDACLKCCLGRAKADKHYCFLSLKHTSNVSHLRRIGLNVLGRHSHLLQHFYLDFVKLKKSLMIYNNHLACGT